MNYQVQMLKLMHPKHELSKIQKTLKDLRSLLAEPYTWTKGRLIRQNSRAPGGFSYCLIGGLEHINGKWQDQASLMLRNKLQELEGHTSITKFNDSVGKAKVLRLIDDCIYDLEQELVR